jgi:acyl-CoA dehydrogenase
LQNLQVNRLKDKLGTRKVPTAELSLDGTPALLVAGLDQGVRHIAPMLAITRTWNAVCAAAAMRRAVALSRDYARRRVVFGSPLAEKPLHAETLADLQAEAEVGFHLAFRCVELLGREEAAVASEGQRLLLRLLTSLAKLVTGKQAVLVASEALEIFGGAGYVEDTGIPRLLRDAQVLPIWEGTTNVLALDALKVLGEDRVVVALAEDADALAMEARDPELRMIAQRGLEVLRQATRWLTETSGRDLEAGARGLALTVGRTYGLLLLCRQAQWSLDHERDRRAAASCRRFASRGLNWLREADPEARALANDEPLRKS